MKRHDHYIDPNKFSLNKGVVLSHGPTNYIAIIINRKSRIIMKDGLRILEQAKRINAVLPAVKVSVETNAPVCSKTNRFLSYHRINITNL